MRRRCGSVGTRSDRDGLRFRTRARVDRQRDCARSRARPAAGRLPPRRPSRPSARDLRTIFFFNAVPFVAFGFVDNTVLIHAGGAIDASVGVTFGLSSLAAAAMGQIASDTSGVLFGSTIENAALRLGFAAPRLTPAQQMLRVTQLAERRREGARRDHRLLARAREPAVRGTLAVEKAKEEKEYTAIFRAIMHRGHEVAEVRGGGAVDRRLRKPNALDARRAREQKKRRHGSAALRRRHRRRRRRERPALERLRGVRAPALRPHRGQGRHHRVHEPVAAHRAGVRRRRARRRRRAAREQKARRRRSKGKGRKDDA